MHVRHGGHVLVDERHAGDVLELLSRLVLDFDALDPGLDPGAVGLNVFVVIFHHPSPNFPVQPNFCALISRSGTPP